MNTNKADRSDRNRQAIAGVQKYFAKTPAIILDGVSRTPADVEKALQAAIDTADATNVAAAAFHKAVADEKAANVAGDSMYKGLKTFVISQFKTSPSTLADFGMSLPSRQVPSAATAADAVKKRAATRTARHTMGKKQKQKVTGTVATAPPPTASAAAPIAAGASPTGSTPSSGTTPAPGPKA